MGLKTAGMLACVAVGSFFTYQGAVQKMEQMQSDYESRLSERVDVYVTKQLEEAAKDVAGKLAKEESEAISAEASLDKLDVNTIFQIQKYDAATDKTVTEYETLPGELVGASRKDVDAYFQQYTLDLPAEEFLDGLQSVGVVSFSKERLVVKKIYDASKVDYRYYLIALDGEVVVYYGDKKTVYEYTGIEVKDLPAQDRKALKNGIEVKDEEELYSILENFSS